MIYDSFYVFNPNSLREEIIDFEIYSKKTSELEAYILNATDDYNKQLYSLKLADYYRINNDLEKAIVFINNALTLFSKNANSIDLFRANLLLAICYQYQEKYDLALNIFEKLEMDLPLNGYDSFVYQHRGKLEFDRKNYVLALSYFEKAKYLRVNDESLLYSTELAINRTKQLIKENIIFP